MVDRSDLDKVSRSMRHLPEKYCRAIQGNGSTDLDLNLEHAAVDIKDAANAFGKKTFLCTGWISSIPIGFTNDHHLIFFSYIIHERSENLHSILLSVVNSSPSRGKRTSS